MIASGMLTGKPTMIPRTHPGTGIRVTPIRKSDGEAAEECAEHRRGMLHRNHQRDVESAEDQAGDDAEQDGIHVTRIAQRGVYFRRRVLPARFSTGMPGSGTAECPAARQFQRSRIDRCRVGGEILRGRICIVRS
jgi:hypothetical protein